MMRLLSVLMAMSLLACNLAFAQAKQVGDLAWIKGPTTGQIGATASIKVPEGYAFLGPDGAREFNRITENPDTGIDESTSPAGRSSRSTTPASSRSSGRSA